MTVAAEFVILAAAAVAATAALWKTMRQLVRKLDALDSLPGRMARLESLVNRELTHNHGSSIKDDMTGLAVGMGHLSRTVEQLRDDFDDHTKKGKKK